MNTLGTEKVKYSLSAPTPQKPKRKKKLGSSLSKFEPSHWLHENFILKFVCQHFSGGLMGSMGVDW